MKDITRRDFVRTSMAAGATATTVAAAAAQSQPQTPAERIKIVALSCSPRKGKSTAAALGVCLEAARQAGDKIETELIELADFRINGNLAAGVVGPEGGQDDFPKLAPRLADPKVRGIIVGTPVYFGGMSSLCKAFLDRAIVLWQNDFALSGKVAGVLACGGTRNGGQEVTIHAVQVSLFCQEMILVGNGRPGPRIGATVWSGAEGGVLKDEFGMTTAKALGRRVAEVAMRLATA
ncbi:MAG: flavodoxin family protein [Solirubrobacterales bacterium]